MAVLLAIYLTGAGTNLSILLANRKRGHKFLISLVLTWFCGMRAVTCALRIAWATHPHNIRLAIAAQILVSAGVLLLYLVNLLFAQRILRSTQPHIGWARSLSWGFRCIYALLVFALLLVISFTVLTVYTLDARLKSIALSVQRAAVTYLLFVAALPLLILTLAIVLPHPVEQQVFGQGTLRSKQLTLLLSTGLCVVIAGFKAGTLWETPRMVDNPAW